MRLGSTPIAAGHVEPEPVRAVVPDTREAKPTLAFPAASFGVHLLLEDVAPPEASAGQDAFTYHQWEFVSYAHRDAPPFVVQPLSAPPGLARLECRLPEVVYTRAGKSHRLEPRSQGHAFELSASRAYFETSGLSVLHVVLTTPDAEAGSLPATAPISEFGVVRIAKLWEGGEDAPALDVSAAGLRLAGDPWSLFAAAGVSLDLAAIVDAVRAFHFPDSRLRLRPPPPRPGGCGSDRPYLTGSVQLRTGAVTMRRLVTELQQLQDPLPRDPGAPAEDPGHLMALSGLLRAFMAFDDTHAHELPSIFRQTTADRRLITAVHKGTFLRIAHDMRMPSAYFLLPHSIALHNEALLDSAITAGARQPGDDGQARNPRAADPLDAARREVTHWLDQMVDAEVIHYPNLRALYERAAASRGMDGLEARARRYADELRIDSDAIRNRQQSVAQAAIALIALGVGALQVDDIVPWYLGIPGALILVWCIVWLLPTISGTARGSARSRR